VIQKVAVPGGSLPVALHVCRALPLPQIPNTSFVVLGTCVRAFLSCKYFQKKRKKKASSKSSKTDQAICTESPCVQKAAAECDGLIWSPSSVIPSLSLSIILLFSRLICTMGKNQQRLKNVQFEA